MKKFLKQISEALGKLKKKVTMARRIEPQIIFVEVAEPLERTEHGEVCLDRGNHDITIVTRFKPRKVFFSFKDEGEGMPVCMGNVDLVGTTILPDGFVLYARITSERRHIRWSVVEE